MPIALTPEIVQGNMPNDGGYYVFTEYEREQFLKREPQAENLFRKCIGADEFINGYERYFLWLADCSPSDLKKLPECMKRIELVRRTRLASTNQKTKKQLAETPTRFERYSIPQSTYLIIPRVSSENRDYIPIGFITPDILPNFSVRIIPNATLYHFGILTSNVHNAWMRVVCGRLENRYAYTDIVYNNFAWPNATDEQKASIEKLAQVVLDARAKFPDSSLGDLYDPVVMPQELIKAHAELDKAVMKLYGFKKDATEKDMVAALMDMMVKLKGEKGSV